MDIKYKSTGQVYIGIAVQKLGSSLLLDADNAASGPSALVVAVH